MSIFATNLGLWPENTYVSMTTKRHKPADMSVGVETQLWVWAAINRFVVQVKLSLNEPVESVVHLSFKSNIGNLKISYRRQEGSTFRHPRALSQGSVVMRLLTSWNPSTGDLISNRYLVFVISPLAAVNVGILQQYLRGRRASAAGRYHRFYGWIRPGSLRLLSL